MNLHRRGFLLGLGAALAAPAIVRADMLMPLRGLLMPLREALTHDVTYYIAEGGVDSNNGLSPLYPVRSFQKLLNRLDLNGHHVTFQIASGHYQEDITFPEGGEVTLAVINNQTVTIEKSHIGSYNQREPVLYAGDNSLINVSNTGFEMKALSPALFKCS